jgi:hypothetical protein
MSGSSRAEREKAFLDSMNEKNLSWRKLGSSNLIEEMIVKHGRFWTPAARPKGERKRQDKQCFSNSQLWLMKRLLLGDVPEWRYCEGLAASPRLGDSIGVHHGWLVNREGVVLDLTWRNPEAALYYGTAIHHDYLKASVARTKMWCSVFDNHYLNHQLIQGAIPESEWKDVEAMKWGMPG